MRQRLIFLAHCCTLKNSLGIPQCLAVIYVAFKSFVKFRGVSLSKKSHDSIL